MQPTDIMTVRKYFLDLQSQICDALEAIDGGGNFSLERIETPGGGLAQPRVLENGAHVEKAAVQFSHSIGASLPPAATERNPHLAGNSFQATAISVIVHPLSPHVPTTHMNLRYFLIESEQAEWFFGGGYDLTPFYPVDEDVIHWHATARQAVGENYARFKRQCDEYFYLPHREECRGVGGIFFDDWRTGGMGQALSLVHAVGDSFLEAYLPIFRKRMQEPVTAEQRQFQLYRRGRYAEFNLAIDRGTRYGLQSGRRVESVLASLPPVAHWKYDFKAQPGSPEAILAEAYLKPRTWI